MTPRDITTAKYTMEGVNEAYALVDARSVKGECVWCGTPAQIMILIFGPESFCSPEHGNEYIQWYCDIEGK